MRKIIVSLASELLSIEHVKAVAPACYEVTSMVLLPDTKIAHVATSRYQHPTLGTMRRIIAEYHPTGFSPNLYDVNITLTQSGANGTEVMTASQWWYNRGNYCCPANMTFDAPSCGDPSGQSATLNVWIYRYGVLVDYNWIKIKVP
jgi:hypothetical protein